MGLPFALMSSAAQSESTLLSMSSAAQPDTASYMQ